MSKDGVGKPAGNEDQIAYWNAATGHKWVALQAGLDSFLQAPLDRLLLRAKLVPSETVLDIGCGAGASTLACSQMVGATGQVVGVDVSRPLLDRAEQLRDLGKTSNVTFLLADAQVHPFEPAAFDLAISRFGVMFFADPVAAFENITQGLKPDGRIMFASWASITNNPWFSIGRDIAIEYLGRPAATDPRAPGPFAFADIEYVTEILCDAGLQECVGDADDIVLKFDGTLEDAASIVTNSGAANRIIREFDANSETVHQIEQDLAAALEQFVCDGRLEIPAVVNYFSAVRR